MTDLRDRPPELSRGAALPLVSIVTPTLNRAHFLEATLASVRDQTYPHVEHIVVDGGSTDGSIALLGRLETQYDLRWVSRPDSGMYAAINRGLKMARGEILAYLNSDDLYLPWTVARVVERFIALGCRSGFLFGDAVNVDADNRARLLLQPPFDLGYVRRTGFLTQPAVFWTRDVYEGEGGFDERLRFVADCEFWMRAGERWPFIRVDDVLAVERDHDETHRSVNSRALRDELASVRLAYRPSGLRGAALRWRDRVWAYLWRRILLVQFVAACARSTQGSGSWTCAIDGLRPRVRWSWLVLSLVPRFGSRYYPTAIRWRTPMWPPPVPQER